MNSCGRIGNEKPTIFKKVVQEIAKKWKNCEETKYARHLIFDDLSLQQERNPTTVSQFLTRIQDLQNTENFLSDAREFYDPDTASSSGASHVPSQPLIIPSPREVRSRDSGLLCDTRNTMGTSGNVFESRPAREGPPSSMFEEFGTSIWKRKNARAAKFGNTYSTF